MWISFTEIAAMGDAIMSTSPMPDALSLEELYGIYDMESAVIGVQVTDAGLDVRFRTDGGMGTMPDQSDWLERIGGLRPAQVAAIMTVPDDLSEFTEPVIEAMDEMFNSKPKGLGHYIRNQWDYEQALTDDEVAEYEELLAEWQAGQYTEDDPDYDRLIELHDQYWIYGARTEYDEWIAAGKSDAQWRYEQALTHEEFYEYVELTKLFHADALDEDEVDYYYELDVRLYSFGLVSDHPEYEPPVDVVALVEEIYDLASGASFAVTLSNLFTEPDVRASATLPNGPADRILDLPIPELERLLEGLGDKLVFDGDTVTLGEVTATGGNMAQHPRFDEAFAGMPDEASMALFVDVQALVLSAPEPDEWLKQIKALSVVQDTTGSGVIRILID